MTENSDFDPATKNKITINPGATVIEARNAHGKLCQLIDNTGTIHPQELTKLLSELTENNHFGINALSSTNGVIDINKPKLTHIQINDNLYRLLVYRYQAVIENF